jgi:hypothetical protein
VELPERLPDLDAVLAQAQLADRPLVPAAPLLDHGKSLPHLARRLEVAEQDDRVRQVGHVHGGGHALADQPVLRGDEQ